MAIESNLSGNKSFIDQAIAGAIAGTISRFFIAPLDVWKIRWQIQQRKSGSTINGSRMHHVLRDTIRTEGFKSLWKGNLSAELLYLLYGAVQFPLYHLCRRLLCESAGQNFDGQNTLIINMISGGIAGGFATTISYPFDLLRTRFAAQASNAFVEETTSGQSLRKNQPIYHNLRRGFARIYCDEGFNGFFRGLTPTLLQIVPHMAITFGCYVPIFNFFNESWIDKDEKSYGKLSASAISGAISGMLAKTVVMPFDVIRKRLQVQGPSRTEYAVTRIPDYTNSHLNQVKSKALKSKDNTKPLIHIVRQLASLEGARHGLFRGWTLSLLKSGVGSAATFLFYNLVISKI